MEYENYPNYYGILPANVRYDNSLTMFEKILFSELTALTNKEGYCWAKDEYFAELYDRSIENINRSFSNLEKQGYIYRDTKIIPQPDGSVKKCRAISILTRLSIIDQKINNVIDQKVKYNNINNNIYNSEDNQEDKSTNVPLNEPTTKSKNKAATFEDGRVTKEFGTYLDMRITKEEFEIVKREYPDDYNDVLNRFADYYHYNPNDLKYKGKNILDAIRRTSSDRKDSEDVVEVQSRNKVRRRGI